MPVSIILPQNCVWVTIEGADKVGKTTLFSRLTQALSDALPAFQVIAIPEITRSPSGIAIKAAYESGHFRLNDKSFDSQIGDALLWFADQYNSLNIALASITTSTILLSDRGPDSRRILQELKLTKLHTLDNTANVIQWIDMILAFLPVPDFTLVLSTDFEITKSRMGADLEYEKYMRAAKKMFDRLPLLHCARVVPIDANVSIECVFDDALKAIVSRFSKNV